MSSLFPPPQLLQSQRSLENFLDILISPSLLFWLPFGDCPFTLTVLTNVINDLRVTDQMNIFQSSSHLTHQWNFPLLTNSCCSWFSWLTQPYIFLLFLFLFFFWTPFQVSSSSNLSCKELVALWGPALGALFHSHFARALKDLTAPVASSPILKRWLTHLPSVLWTLNLLSLPISP